MRAHVYTRTATVATLVGWQVSKVNSPVSPLSILHRRRKRLRISGTANRAKLGFILSNKSFLGDFQFFIVDEKAIDYE